MKRVLYTVLCLFLVVGCRKDVVSSTDERPPPVSVSPRTNDAQWVTAVRDGGIPNSVDAASASSWLAENLTRGESTKKEVLAIFGEPGRSGTRLPSHLDRPERDDVAVYQYYLWHHDGANWGCLVIHFDSKTDVLLDWEISHSICGYCPHVFAFDEQWRLEGKMLAGSVGKQKTGVDTLLLPRLTVRGNSLFVKLSNLAPEVDHVTEASLAAVFLNKGEELDISAAGNLVVWRPQRQLPVEFPPAANGASAITVDFDPKTGSDVIVLEVRNTFAFETAMRRLFLEGKKEVLKTTLTLDFGWNRLVEIQPVGTKFLRRIVVAVPERTTGVTLRAEGDFWYTRRLWLGTDGSYEHVTAWQEPMDARPISLLPMEDTVLAFHGHRDTEDSTKRMGYALRIRGYYDFVKNR